jgi:Na+/H+ antiporter NhaD/arsenite permease-like protein
VIALILIFVFGYLMIAFEQVNKIPKAASALLTGSLCWLYLAVVSGGAQALLPSLSEHFSETASIIIFLMAAMTIVEVIDSHEGFSVITSRIKTKNKRVLLWILSFITFFLSAVLDNLTTAIVMVGLITRLTEEQEDRLVYTAMVVIAANAGLGLAIAGLRDRSVVTCHRFCQRAHFQKRRRPGNSPCC